MKYALATDFIANQLNPPVLLVISIMTVVLAIMTRRPHWGWLAAGWLANLLYLAFFESLASEIVLFGVAIRSAAAVNFSLLTGMAFLAYGFVVSPPKLQKVKNHPVLCAISIGIMVILTTMILSFAIAGDFLALLRSDALSPKSETLIMTPLVIFSFVSHFLAGSRLLSELKEYSLSRQLASYALLLYATIQPLYLAKHFSVRLFLVALAAAWLTKCGFALGLFLVFIRDTEEKHRRRAERIYQEHQQKAFSWFAHEVKNPVHAINNSAEAILRFSRTRRLTQAIKEAGRLTRETKLLVGVVDAVKLAAEPLQEATFTTFSVNTALDRAMEVVGSQIQHNSSWIHKNYSRGVDVYGAFNPAVQVFANIIRNALEACLTLEVSDYKISGGLRLSLETRRTVEGLIIVRIVDFGPGIPSGVLDHVLEAYVSSKEGINRGLGLWVARNFVEYLAGEISIESPVPRFDRGTVVEVRLPQHEDKSETETA